MSVTRASPVVGPSSHPGKMHDRQVQHTVGILFPISFSEVPAYGLHIPLIFVDPVSALTQVRMIVDTAAERGGGHAVFVVIVLPYFFRHPAGGPAGDRR